MSKLIKIKRLCRVSLWMLCLLQVLMASAVQAKSAVTTVVIDAGHGGHDSGCLGENGVKEKDVALGISLKLGKLIEDNFPDVKVVYTRKSDVFLELHERADIANSSHADLFICVHCNSACFMDKKKRKETCNEDIVGVESWIMGLHKTEANLEIAKRENNVMLMEKDYVKQYDGFNPNSSEADIIFTLYQNTFMDQSLQIASLVQEELGKKGRAKRGVKQAGFWVLYKTAMPSVLIETGFLSNPTEERYLGSVKGQQEMAGGIYRAFRSYKRQLDGETLARPVPENEEPEEVKTETSSDKSVEDQKVETVASPEVFLSIQFITSTKKLSAGSERFKGLKDVVEDKKGESYRYCYGHFTSMDDAVRAQGELRDKGFKDAFVVAFRNKERIPVSDARAALNQTPSR